MKYANMAIELITWLRSKTILIGVIKELSPGTGLSVLRPFPTRWTAYFLSFDRILIVRPYLSAAIASDAIKPQDEKIVIQGDAKAKAKATKMVAIASNSLFWNKLANIKLHLEPLAIAANLSQSTFCRLDDVFITFGFLHARFLSFNEPESRSVQTALISSLTKRWQKADREVFILTVILNPLIKLAPFKLSSRLFQLAKLQILVQRTWGRLYKEEAPIDLSTQIQDYLRGEGDFEDLEHAVKMEKLMAEKKVNIYASNYHVKYLLDAFLESSSRSLQGL